MELGLLVGWWDPEWVMWKDPDWVVWKELLWWCSQLLNSWHLDRRCLLIQPAVCNPPKTPGRLLAGWQCQ